ncbi:hypothetical protein ACT7C6_09605 [Bacillus paranthracis]
MISVGIDVAKEKSVVAIMNEERKLLKKVVTLNHTMSEISAFIELFKLLSRRRRSKDNHGSYWLLP